MRILVTGSRGPLGIAMQKIQSEVHKMSQFFFTNSQDLNLLDEQRVVDFFKTHRPDLVIHLAARSGGAAINRVNPSRVFEDNISMAMNLLRAGTFVDTEKYILVSSTAGYPVKRDQPAKESTFFDGPPSESDKFYAHAKRMIEILAEAYRREFDMKIWVPVVNGIAGAGMNFDDDKSVMLAGIIKRFFNQYHSIDRFKEYRVLGDGTPIREYTYSLDLARAIFSLIEFSDTPRLINIGNNQGRMILDYAKLVAEKIGIDLDLIKTERNQGYSTLVYNQTTDNSYFLEKTGFKFTPIEIAISDAVDFYATLHEKAQL